MRHNLLTISGLPKAVLHVDGDCFFASCEKARNPELKNKPVVTGMERSIASSLSYEAKARGVKRGMSLWEVKKICPDVVILPSDYETYCLYSIRLYDIVKRYTEQVEEYSIDECFADLTGMRRPLNMSYEEMAGCIKNDLDSELGMTFSVGLAPTKVLAKIASKWNKPSGLTVIKGRDAHNFLEKTDCEDVWGIGVQTSCFLKKFGINTALDLAFSDEGWVKKNLSKPYHEIWQELRGKSVYEVGRGAKEDYKSISKTKTFTPANSDKDFVFSQLSKNVENACIKARRHKLEGSKVFFYLKTNSFRIHGLEIRMGGFSSSPTEIISIIKEKFDHVFDEREGYRATGFILSNLKTKNKTQLDLFGSVLKARKYEKVYSSVDKLSKKYGKHTLFLGSSFKAVSGKQHGNSRSVKPDRSQKFFKGENKRKKIGLPLLGEAE